jgi:hypothetical protein
MNKIDLQKKIEFIKTKGKPPKIEIDKQEYTKDYFNKVTKQRKRLCEVCSKEIKYNSFSNHLNSKKHTALVEIILSTIDDPLCVEL